MIKIIREYQRGTTDLLKNFNKLKFDEKARTAMHCRSMHPEMFLKLT